MQEVLHGNRSRARNTRSLEEYLSTSYHPDRDFVDGVLEERNAGEFEHSKLQARLSFWFLSHEEEWDIEVATEYRTRTGPTRIRIPDVTVLSRSAVPEDVRTTPALLCIEIVSPKDRLSRTVEVMEDYLAMGVRNLWIIDPNNRLAYTYTQSGLLKAASGRLEIAGSPIFLDVGPLFATLDRAHDDGGSPV